MKKKEPAGPVPLIQFLDAARGDLEVFRVLRHVLPRRVRKIAQQREAQIRIRISEVTNLEAVQFVPDCIRRREQHRHHDQRAGNRPECLLS